jgi:hypothetical protein
MATTDLIRLLVAIAEHDHKAAADILDAAPSLATATMARCDEFFLIERGAQVYAGDTALHAAGFSYDCEMARDLITRGADIRARNRRGAEPLHAAVTGGPGSASWNPVRQREIIRCSSPWALIPTQPPTAASHRCTGLSGTGARPPSRHCCTPAPILACRTTVARPRLTSPAGQLGAVARARQRPGPNSESLSNCSRFAPPEPRSGLTEL